jgi:hypothetical protein
MTKQEMCKLSEIINNSFGEPYNKKELVSSFYNEKNKHLNINIGEKNIKLNSNLEIIGAGKFTYNELYLKNPESLYNI